MMKKIIVTTCLAIMAMTSWAITAQEAVDAFVANKGLSHAAMGVAVFDVDSNRLVAGHLADQAMVTASTMKTVTSVAALETLGGDFRFKTPVYMQGKVQGDTLVGNVLIVGDGDPTLGSRFFPKHPNIVAEVVAALKDAGIKTIMGKVLTDESLFPYPPYSIHWDVGDLAWDYGAAVPAICYSDNVLQVRFSVDKWGRYTPFRLVPHVPGVQVINRMNFRLNRENTDFALEYATPAVVLMGDVKPGSYNMRASNPSPSALLADSLTHALVRAGVAVEGRDEVLSYQASTRRQLLVTHESPELTDIVTSLLDRSDNMFTHALLRALAVRDRSWNGGEVDAHGVKVVRRVLARLGVDASALFMRDGSGLARAGKASPALLTHMLAQVATKEYNGKRLCELMPKAGNRVGKLLPKTSLRNDIVLKSGSMSDVQCFVGYYPAENPRYTFAILANNYNCSRAELCNYMDQLLISLFQDK